MFELICYYERQIENHDANLQAIAAASSGPQPATGLGGGVGWVGVGEGGVTPRFDRSTTKAPKGGGGGYPQAHPSPSPEGGSDQPPPSPVVEVVLSTKLQKEVRGGGVPRPPPPERRGSHTPYPLSISPYPRSLPPPFPRNRQEGLCSVGCWGGWNLPFSHPRKRPWAGQEGRDRDGAPAGGDYGYQKMLQKARARNEELQTALFLKDEEISVWGGVGGGGW